MAGRMFSKIATDSQERKDPVSIIFLPEYWGEMWMVDVLLFSKIVAECGGVTEDQIDSLAAVTY